MNKKEEILKWIKNDLNKLIIKKKTKEGKDAYSFHNFFSPNSGDGTIILNQTEGQEICQKVFEKIKDAPDNWEIMSYKLIWYEGTIINRFAGKSIKHKEVNGMESDIEWECFSPEQQKELDKIITNKHEIINDTRKEQAENISFWDKFKNTLGARKIGATSLLLTLYILLIITGVLALLWLFRKITSLFQQGV